MSIKNFYKYFPLKQYGQNFLINKNVINDIIKIINPQKHQILVEIGPGLAALTKPICQFLEELIVIEIDVCLVDLLKKYFFCSKIKIFHQDALNFDYKKLYFKKNKLIRVFGNLPYNISTSLILYLFKQIEAIEDMNFMLQKEVAERLVASPGNKSYGRLSIISQYYCKIKILLHITPENFQPIPKVHSVFINLTPHKNFLYFVYDVNILSRITKIAFQNRRKIIRHSLKTLFSEKELIELKINPKFRAENISIIEYCRLSNYLYKKFNNLKKN
ncbi:16S rRNA (adenine(1518)-N(6)/adenine(1519)-N(6))-dimethyltransferase RsmA [Buchnera aphidicola]|uniref:Ribosomal RNA small subunit methyltransferase A n=1 Tax=Buchnera aphidicola (Artemisaphis artemisicola) TaxID=1241836 RepID=A0A4D6XHD8_9GAMM|nr:16S rRNA (adenine(1518)-N(6)/adenine(1519)-N(6))-dimethyltransferase RsmA [Buchnera aphidicola]QCI15832.1 16S rRNA (adenine(1518)-N(6)/adenine(1519)-N(6))-dimethyltransferase RsmA [Buchnera aphidicola (Artemisaphis artemisicola)]